MFKDMFKDIFYKILVKKHCEAVLEIALFGPISDNEATPTMPIIPTIVAESASPQISVQKGHLIPSTIVR